MLRPKPSTKRPLPQCQAALLALQAHTAVAELVAGRATLHEWRSLGNAVNLVNALCRLRGPGSRVAFDLVVTARYALADAALDANGGVVLTGDAADVAAATAALTAVVNAYDRALSTLALRTILDATNIVDADVLAGAAPSRSGDCAMLTEPDVAAVPAAQVDPPAAVPCHQAGPPQEPDVSPTPGRPVVVTASPAAWACP